MFAYDKQGAVFAMREGAELLVHDGPSEGPLWSKTLDGTIVGLGADGDQVIAVTETGAIKWFNARSGDEIRSAKLDTAVRTALVDVAKPRIVAITPGAIVAHDGNTQTTLADHTARAIAMRPDGTVLAATDNELVILAPDGTRTASPSPGTLEALAWHPEGFWVLGAPARLHRWNGSGEPSHITNLPAGAKLDHVTCSARAIAVSWDRHMVVTLAWPSKETLGSLNYLERKVEGIDFGPWPWLGIALDLGDGNKHNLDQPDRLHRSDTHPGREHHSWLVEAGGSGKPKAKASAAAAPPLPSSDTRRPTSRGIYLAVLAIIVAVVYYVLR